MKKDEALFVKVFVNGDEKEKIDVSNSKRKSVLGALSTNAEVLNLLAADSSSFARRAVAANPNTPLKTLVSLMNDGEVGVVIALAHNPVLPETMLIELAKNQDPLVRANVAANPASAPEILKLLSRDKDFHVALNVVYNESVSVDILQDIQREHQTDKRGLAYKAEKREPEVATRSKEEHEQAKAKTDDKIIVKVFMGEKEVEELLLTHMLALLLATESKENSVLKMLATYKDAAIKKALASNPNISHEVFEMLVEDEEESTARHLATNPSLPQDVADKLACKSERVRRRLARNPGLSPETMDKIIDNSTETYTLWELLNNPGLLDRSLVEKIASKEISGANYLNFRNKRAEKLTSLTDQ